MTVYLCCRNATHSCHSAEVGQSKMIRFSGPVAKAFLKQWRKASNDQKQETVSENILISSFNFFVRVESRLSRKKFPMTQDCFIRKSFVHWEPTEIMFEAVVVAQLLERLLPTPEIRISNPNISKVLSTNWILNRKDKNKGKEAGNGASLKKMFEPGLGNLKPMRLEIWNVSALRFSASFLSSSFGNLKLYFRHFGIIEPARTRTLMLSWNNQLSYNSIEMSGIRHL